MGRSRTRFWRLAGILALVVAAVLIWRFRYPREWCSHLEYLQCMKLVRGGTFSMGAQARDPEAPGYDPEAADDEGPVHEVKLSAFYIDQNEVPVRAYRNCVEARVCDADEVSSEGGYLNFGNGERDLHPLNGVTWEGARQLCEWLGGRLPSEAEWESAARGSDGWRFSWGDDLPTCEPSSETPLPESCPTDGTTNVGASMQRSPAGAMGMCGSVWEWVADWYAPDYYAASPRSDPRGPADGARRAQRGGSWDSEGPLDLRAARRAGLPPDSRLADLGFRCARTPEPRWSAWFGDDSSSERSKTSAR